MPAVLALALVGSALAACADASLPTSADPAPLRAEGAVFAKASQVSVCHRTGSGSYRLLTINGNALAAHQAHGDAVPGAPVPDGSGARFGDDCVPQAEDVTGTYVLQTVGGEPLPALGTGEELQSGTLVLNADGSCSLSTSARRAQEDPEGEIEDFAFQSCEYSLDGTALTLVVFDGEEEATLAARLIGAKIILPILIWDDTDEADEGVMGDAVFVKV